jgi:hypothetical protein
MNQRVFITTKAGEMKAVSIFVVTKLLVAARRARARARCALWRRHRPLILRPEWRRLRRIVREQGLLATRAGLGQKPSVKASVAMFDAGFTKVGAELPDVWTQLRRTRSAPGVLKSEPSPVVVRVGSYTDVFVLRGEAAVHRLGEAPVHRLGEAPVHRHGA